MTYYLHNNGVVREGVECPGEGLYCAPRPVVVVDPEDREQVARLVDEYVRPFMGNPVAENYAAMKAALHSLNEPPTEVYEHYTRTTPKSGKPHVALCGKVWRPGAANTVSIGKCPECAETIQCGWVS